MEKQREFLGWLRFNSVVEANIFIGQINSHLGFPTPDSKTLTWAIPSCLQNDYSPNDTDQGWFVVIKDECYDCLTQEQKDSIITELPFNIVCGTPEPPITGDTSNYVGS